MKCPGLPWLIYNFKKYINTRVTFCFNFIFFLKYIISYGNYGQHLFFSSVEWGVQGLEVNFNYV